jgi:hypothetical protein
MPYKLAFIETGTDSAWFIMEVLIDCFFAIDVIVN